MRSRALTHVVLLAAAAAWAGGVHVAGQAPGARTGRGHPSLTRQHPAIDYAGAPTADPVIELQRRLDRGEAVLESDASPTGYLRSLLDALRVPVESQVLVFSKTSFQASRIGPASPRAIYFNDTVSVGWVRGGPVLELVAQDPRQGAIFYTLEQDAEGAPRFERNDTCVMCHASDATHNVPGMFVGSVYPGLDGTTMYGPAYTTDHRSPFELRWGGWFVTGTHRATRHMGNAVATMPTDLAAMITPETVHVTSLEGRFDQTDYLSHDSDLVALMVLEHQAQMLNLITRVNWEARMGDEAPRPLDAAVAQLVDYLLFVDEAPLPGPVAGTTAFAANFALDGPRDGQGRSLRELQLEQRLLKYPCSYLIYSKPFEALPAEVKAAIYDRMWTVLSGEETGERYAVLSEADRTAVVEILRDTKPDLPDYWR
jgi:hypothetical protein